MTGGKMGVDVKAANGIRGRFVMTADAIGGFESVGWIVPLRRLAEG